MTATDGPDIVIETLRATIHTVPVHIHIPSTQGNVMSSRRPVVAILHVDKRRGAKDSLLKHLSSLKVHSY